MPVILTLQKWRQKDQELEASMDYKSKILSQKIKGQIRLD
jgi:hypothetical protein